MRNNYCKKKIPFLLLGILLSLSIYGQKITKDFKNTPLKSVLEEVKSQSGFSIIYETNEVNDSKLITESFKDASIENVLSKVLDSKFDFAVDNKMIVIFSRQVGRKVNASALKQISGIVTDESGDPLIGAVVTIKGTQKGITTDENGRFTLEVASSAMLTVSYVGYSPIELAIGNRVNFKVELKENMQILDEIIVVGYGTQKKVNLTGAVTAINTEDLKDRAQTNVLSAAQGKVPGVTIISRPGSAPSINFRGRGNLGTSDPLFVIDGVISSSTVFSNLDPNTIESISFLKDAASSSIYGSRAAYGVVLVTTKGGVSGKTDVLYSGIISFSNPTYKTKYVNSWEYAELYNEALYNSKPSGGKYQGYSQEEIGWFRDGSKPDLYPNTNWEDLVLDKNVMTTQHTLNVSGGSDKLRFFTSLGYVYNDDIIPNRHGNRYNITTNVVGAVTKWLDVKAGVKYIQNYKKVSSGTPLLANFAIVPSTFVAQHTNGGWGSVNGGSLASIEFIQRNPLRVLNNGDWSNSKTENSYYDMGVDIKPLKGLLVSGSVVYKRYENKGKNYTSLKNEINNYLTGDLIAGSGNTTNLMTMDWSSTSTLIYTATAKYDWTKDKHALNTLLGSSYEHYKYERLYGSRDNFPLDGLTDMGAGSTSGAGYTNAAGSTENKMLSYFGRINYSFNDRYLFEANLRADASSRFHKDHRWGYFPSFSGGWRVSEEQFMKTFTWLDNLKVRASWGMLGNINNVGDYDYFQNYSSSSNYSFGDDPVKGIKESRPANATLGWEKVAMTDIGIDFDIMGGLFSITADYYNKKTSDILLAYNVPLETGISTAPSQNIGKVRNTGFEVGLTHRKKINDFSYEVGVNFATNKNEVLDLATSNNIINGKYILREGESIGSFYGYKTDGLYTQEDIDAGRYYTLGGVTPNPGDIKFLPNRSDVGYKEAITGEDRVIIGCDVPDLTYGINISLKYKNFDFSAFGQGVSGTKVAFDTYGLHPLYHGMDSPRRFHLNRWTEENPNPKAIYPRIYSSSDPHTKYNWNFNDQHLFDADYFRVKTLTLGYTIPRSLTRNWGISAFKVFATCENMFTIRADKKMKDFDPETAGGVIGTFGTKSFAFGLNLSF